MAVQEHGSVGAASVVGRACAVGAILGAAWVAGGGSVVRDAAVSLVGQSGLAGEMLHQGDAAALAVSCVAVGLLAGVLAKLVLPRTMSPRLLVCLLAGMVAVVLVGSLGVPLGCSIPSDLSILHLSVTAAAASLLVLGGQLLRHL